MKSIRLVTFALVFVIIFSVWTPTAVFAKTAQAGTGKTLPALVSLTVANRTFGPLWITLQGSAGTYYFYAVRGKNTYQIVPGKYTYMVSFAPSSMCNHWLTAKPLVPVAKTKKFNHLQNSISLGAICTLR